MIPPQDTLSVVTWNVNEGKNSFDGVIQTIQEEASLSDILFLQEITLPILRKVFPPLCEHFDFIYTKSGYGGNGYDPDGYGNLSIIKKGARLQVINCSETVIPPPSDGWFNSTLQLNELKISGTNILLGNFHGPTIAGKDDKKDTPERDIVINCLTEAVGKYDCPIAIVGDWNMSAKNECVRRFVNTINGHNCMLEKGIVSTRTVHNFKRAEEQGWTILTEADLITTAGFSNYEISQGDEISSDHILFRLNLTL